MTNRRQMSQVRDHIITFFRKKQESRPVIVGDICREFHADLSDAIRWVDELVAEGTIRATTRTEARKHDITVGYLLT